MRRLLASIVGLCLIATSALAFYQSRDSNYNKNIVAAGGGYTGPGDIVSGAKAWYGLRCYNAAYTGFVADITDSATGNTTGTRLKCSSGVITAVVGSTCANTSAAAGGGAFVSGGTCSAVATTCAVACNVLTLYDQSGALSGVGSTALDVVQNTNANRPTFTPSGCAGLSGGAQSWCMVDVSGTQTMQSANKIPGGDVQPITHSYVFNWNTYTANASVFAVSGGGGEFSFLNNTPALTINAGTGVAAGGITTGTWQSNQLVFNGASSSADQNGSTTSGLNAGVQGTDNWFIFVMTDSGGFSGNGGKFLEAGYWVSGFNGTQQSNMTANQRGTANGWGF